MKRVLSYVLVFTLLVSMLSIIDFGLLLASAETGNIITNGDFETGDFTGWTPDSVYSISIADKHSGAYSAYVNCSGDWKVMYQAIAVKPNTNYSLSFWYKGSMGSQDITNWSVTPTKDKVEDGINKGGLGANQTYTSWMQKTAGFNSGIYTTLYLYFNMISGTQLYIDDISIIEVDPPVIENGYFETGNLNGWTPESAYTASSLDKHTGTYSVYANCTGDWKKLYQTVTVIPNTDYNLKFWYKGTMSSLSANNNWSVTTTLDGIDTGIVKGAFAAGTTYANWTQKSVVFNSGSYSTLYLYFQFRTNTQLFIDDISIAEADPPIVKNGGFEKGYLINWGPSSAFSISSSEKHTGTYSTYANCISDWKKLYQAVTVKPNTDYNLTFWYKGTIGSLSTNNWSIATAKDGIDTGIVKGSFGTNMTFTNWTQRSAIFNSGNYTTIYLYFQFRTDTQFYIDDVSIVEADPPVVNNGGFEKGNLVYWKPATAYSESNEEMHTGTYSIYANCTSDWKKLYQSVTVMPDTDYTFTFWYKGTMGSLSSNNWSIATVLDGIDTGIAKGALGTSITFAEWTQKTVEFNSGSNETLYLYFQLRTGTQLYIDDISIVETNPPILRNGNFEKGNLVGWKSDSPYSVSTTEKYGGTYSMYANCSNDWQKVNQTFTVKPYTDYILTFWYKGTTGNQSVNNWSVTATEGGIDTGIVKGGFSVGVTITEWTQKTVDFNSGSNSTLYLYFMLMTEAEMYFDNISIVEFRSDDIVLKEVDPANLRVASANDNLITDSSFEAGTGNWNVSTFMNTGVMSVVNTDLARVGTKALKFSAVNLSSGVWNIFYVNVEPYTQYLFSSWVYGEYRSAANTNDMTFGIINPSTGDFAVLGGDQNRTASRQLSPTTWDEEWHLTGVRFYSGALTNVGIAVYGANSTAYLDDMVLCKYENSCAYPPINSGEVMNITNSNPSLRGCNTSDNLVENYNFSDAASQYWQNGWGYGINVSVKAVNAGFGTSLQYKGAYEMPTHSYYFKWISVEPNTEYTFSARYQVIEEGDGYLGLFDGNDSLPHVFTKFLFSEQHLDNEWLSAAVSFNSGVYTKVGICVCDNGGKANIDNIRIFKTTKGTTLVDAYEEGVSIPENCNLIRNGDFETGDLSCWTPNLTGFSVSNEQKRSGLYSLYVVSGTWKKIYQAISVKPNTNYTLTFWYKGTTGAWANNWSVTSTLNGIDTGIVKGSLGTNATYSSWTKNTASFNSGNNSRFYLYFQTNIAGSQNYALYIDDISIVESPIVKNGDFEVNNLTDWISDAEYSLSSAESHIGNYSVYADCSDDWKKMYQAINVLPDTNYTFTFWYKGTIGSQKANNYSITTTVGGIDSGIVKGSIGANTVIPEWTKMTVNFNTGINTTLYLYFQMMAGTELYIDHIYIIQMDIPILKNGGFEEGNLSSWLYDSAYTASSAESYTGSHSVYANCTGDWKKIYQAFKVTPNTDYTLTFWYKGTFGTNSANNWSVTATVGGIDEGIAKGGLGAGQTFSEWTQKKAQFNSGDNYTLYLYFQMMSGTTLYIDNISVAESGIVL